MTTCEAIEAEFFPCGEPAPYATERDGERTPLCESHAAIAVEENETVIGPSGHAVRYSAVDAELFEGSQA